MPREPRKWRQVESRKIVEDRWMRLRADTCELPSGHLVSPYYVLEERDWTHVFAHDEDGRVLIVRQYRYAADAVCAELPGGVVDPGETPLEAARRELREETGHGAGEWRKVAEVYANPARQTNKIHLFAARDLRLVGEQSLDVSEEISFDFVSPAELRQLIDGGEFSQAMHIASFYLGLEAIRRW